MDVYGPIIEVLTRFGEDTDEIIAAVIIGSRARKEKPADEFSDLDVVLVSSDPARFIESNDWLAEFGRYQAVFVEETVAGQREKRVLFDGGLDADFVVLPVEVAQELFSNHEKYHIFHTGYHVLTDKMGLTNTLPKLTTYRRPYALPTEETFINQVNNFWYHAVWTTKKLLRGELWAAKFCVDGHMKELLLWMIECNAHAHTGSERYTWFNGRFVDSWAEPSVLNALRDCFAHYDAKDMMRALCKTADLFRELAVQTAGSLGFKYPRQADQYCSAWMEDAGKDLSVLSGLPATLLE